MSLWLWGGFGHPSALVPATSEMQDFLATIPALTPYPGSHTHQEQCHGHLHTEDEQQVGDAELGPG